MAPAYPAAREKRIKVCVRLRPFTRNETMRAGGKAAWTWHENTIYQQIFPAQAPARVPAPREKKGGSTTSSAATADAATLPSSYSFDYLFAPAAKTEEIYEDTVKDAIVAAVDGYHSSVFLYGQTGTGKTYTMQGGRGSVGIIQLATTDIFKHIAHHPEMEFLLRLSYLEIYNERVYDLFAGGAKSDVKIFDVSRNNPRDGAVFRDVVVKGLREEIVLSPDHVMSLVEMGNVHRHMATTESNDQSSRSHVIFRMVIESQSKRSLEHPQTNSSPVRSATLNLIDLAGSESVRLASTTGQHLEEGKYINRSLLTLGHIIWKLSRDRQSKGSAPGSQTHLPYRNSKLTRILQPSLGGQAQIAVICTVAPSVECLAETHNTLKFASRARRVKNRAAVNESTGESALLKKYRARIQELEEQLASLQRRRSSANFDPQESSQAHVNLTTLDERQKELQFAISNINRAILNSSTRPDALRVSAAREDAPVVSQRDHIEAANSAPASQQQPPQNTNEPLVDSAGSGATTVTLGSPRNTLESPPVSIPMVAPPPPTAAPVRRERAPEEGNGVEEEVSTSVRSIAAVAPMPAPTRTSVVRNSSGPTSGLRPSLTTVLKSKYTAELGKLDEHHRSRHKDLLREFVRGLEIAEAEQETRMSRINELELENQQLRQILKSREEELLTLKGLRMEDETY